MAKRQYSIYLEEKRPLSLQINDLAALFCGVKRVVYTSIKSSEDSRRIKELCGEFKFLLKELREYRDIENNRTRDILIGTDRKAIEKAAGAYLGGRPYNWGIWLDYPECCVNFFGSWEKDKKESLVKKIAANSNGKGKFDFRINNVFNFYSRINSRKLERKHRRYMTVNREFFSQGLDCEPVLPWHPCSYFCEKSLKAAKEIYNFLETHLPGIAEKRKKILSARVFFKDDFDWFIEQRRSNSQKKISINSFAPPFSPDGLNFIKDIENTRAFEPVPAFLKRNGYILLPFS